MSDSNGHAKTLPQALAAELGRIEELDRRTAETRREVRTVRDLVIKLAHSIDLTREDQRTTLEQVGQLTEAVKQLNTSVQLVIKHLVPSDSPTAETILSARRGG